MASENFTFFGSKLRDAFVFCFGTLILGTAITPLTSLGGSKRQISNDLPSTLSSDLYDSTNPSFNASTTTKPP